MPKKHLLLALFGIALAAAIWWIFGQEEAVDFNRDVKPILNKRCISCHGGVKQKGGFSLLFEKEALGPTESGKPAIIPGDAANSEFIRRLKSDDPDERMPYQHARLPDSEITLLERWVNQGARWGIHWAYAPVKKQAVPNYKDPWINNDIDQFIFARLKQEKLRPSPLADKATILRRVSLDLAGLPPDPGIAHWFLNDNSEDAYERLVDTLLASPGYGERWTALWLDLARYADSKGYEKDDYRNIWRYRDWLIRSFNSDMPYDTFLIMQLAGDLLPKPDDAAYIATAYHRNTMTNNEGGTDNEEFRVAAVIDRVNTTWSTLMSTSFACVQCHSHPYDPFKMKDYYRFLAFFNNDADEDLDNEQPYIRNFLPEDSTRLEKVIAWIKENGTDEQTHRYSRLLKFHQPRYNGATGDQYDKVVLFGNNFAGLKNAGSFRVKNVAFNQQNEMVLLLRYIKNPGTLEIYIDTLSGPPLVRVPLKKTNGWTSEPQYIQLPPAEGQHHLIFRFTSPTPSADDVVVAFDWFALNRSIQGAGQEGYAQVMKDYHQLMALSTETTPVLMEKAPAQRRTTHIFNRGNWFDPAETVSPDVPAVLNPFPEGAPQNRLGLALWLTDKQNPLVARTMANRLWEQLFGTGIVETLEDMGTQGTLPTHQALLDYLSWQFMHEHQWSIKALLKTIVLSSTYRQQSHTNEQIQLKDPNNRLYARGPRLRLHGEQLRDQTLAISKLLNPRMYGQSVMPYQPEGIWRSPYSGERWVESTGGDQYRRSVYTRWKRTAPYPAMITFDGASREVCAERRIRTNTPLQALALLNDPAYLAMARSFAREMMQGSDGPSAQIRRGYRRMLYKEITPQKLEPLLSLYEEALTQYCSDYDAACLITDATDDTTDPEYAAMTVVANALFNLDEWINKN